MSPMPQKLSALRPTHPTHRATDSHIVAEAAALSIDGGGGGGGGGRSSGGDGDDDDDDDDHRGAGHDGREAVAAAASMWALAAKRFASPPYSNGHDTRYETVKAEIRGLYGRDAINAETKGRLKALAVNRGGYGTGYGKGFGKGFGKGKEAEQRRRSREGSILRDTITYAMINRGDHFGEEVLMRNLRLASATAANYCDVFTLECTAFGTVLDALAEEEAENIRVDLGVAIASTRGLFARARDNYVALSKVRGEG